MYLSLLSNKPSSDRAVTGATSYSLLGYVLFDQDLPFEKTLLC